MDVFKEQLVKRKPKAIDAVRRGAILLLALFIILIILVTQILVPFLPLIFFAMAFGIMILFRRMNIEFEYILTNADLDIDIIYGKSRRKRIFEGNVKDMEAFRPYTSNEFDHSFNAAQASLDLSSGVNHEGSYSFLYSYKGKRLKITFEPNSDMLDGIRPHLKRGTYKLER